ncbi:hypothetical protein BJY04DRAFT_223506 [Aspergillus karnatakaensis]|uniref:uncharacterized protein n=1 Tax=Aspergillus karnatakaensis TaxID=1810916 RepID=UPI003CCD4212
MSFNNPQRAGAGKPGQATAAATNKQTQTDQSGSAAAPKKPVANVCTDSQPTGNLASSSTANAFQSMFSLNRNAKRVASEDPTERHGKKKRMTDSEVLGEAVEESINDGEPKRMVAEDEAAEERRESHSPKESRQEDVQAQAQASESDLYFIYDSFGRFRRAVFLLQIAPRSTTGAICKISRCKALIHPGDYRIAVRPGRLSPNDYFHVYCFEELLKLTSDTFALTFRPELKHLAGTVEVDILKECVRRWLARIDATSNSNFPESIWGPSSDGVVVQRFFASETDPDYDESHVLCNALEAYQDYLQDTLEDE